MGTSISPVLATSPVMAKVLVPGLVFVPTARKASAPFNRIKGTLAKVSTLFILVGFPQYPDCAGKGGLSLGIPRSPSMEAIRAVSSPHTKAPAPCFILRLKLKPESNKFSPRKPPAFAWAMAFSSLFIASGYSALIYMTPTFAPMAYPAIIMPSITEWGSPSSMLLSINAPGSPSSALHTTYLGLPAASRVAFHLNQVGKPAPPRPRSPEVFISSMTSFWVMDVTALLMPWYPFLPR